MLALFTQYFIARGSISLPGLGVLSAEPVNARFDAGRQVMVPPRLQFQWQPQTGEAEGVQPLAGFISRHSQMSEEESFEAVTTFCNGVKKALEETGEFTWNGLGKLVKISGDTIGFVPDAALDTYLPVVEAERVAQAGKTHQMLVGDKEINSADMQQMLLEGAELPTEGRWWVAALILGLITLSLIIGRLAGWL